MKTDTIFRSGSVLANVGAPVALLMLLAATVVPFFLRLQGWAMTAYPWIYMCGAFLLLVVRMFTPYRGGDIRIKRLHRMEVWVAIFFCAGAAFVFYPGGTLRDWLAFTIAGAVLQIYTSIAIPYRESKLK